MSTKRIRQKLINLIPIGKLKKWLSYKYGCFPGNHVHYSVKISPIDNLKLGGNVYIGGGGTVLFCHGGIEIGKNTAIAEGCFLISSTHNFKSKTHFPFDKSGFRQKIVIEDNCWIGARSMICPGVKIEEGAIVAMGSVVTKSVPKCAIVGGNPAKIIGWRNIEDYNENAKLNLTWNSESEIKTTTIDGFKNFLIDEKAVTEKE